MLFSAVAALALLGSATGERLGLRSSVGSSGHVLEASSAPIFDLVCFHIPRADRRAFSSGIQKLRSSFVAVYSSHIGVLLFKAGNIY